MEIHLPGLDQIVNVRPLKVKEINLLTDRASLQNGETVNRLLKDALVDSFIDPITLLDGDRNAILFGVRRATWLDDYDITVSCPACRQRQDFTVDLSNIQEKSGDRDLIKKRYEEPNFLAPFQFKGCGLTAWWRFTDGSDFKKLIDINKKKSNQLASESLALRIKRIEGSKEGVPIKRVLEELDASDMSDFNEYYDECAPGHDTKVDLICTNGLCGAEFTVDMPIEPENFFKRSVRGRRSSIVSST